MISALLENEHGGQGLFSEMGTLKEFLQGADTPFTPKELSTAITTAIEQSVSAMENVQEEQHGTKELLAAWGCRAVLSSMRFISMLRVWKKSRNLF